jgi:hypothetical protein
VALEGCSEYDTCQNSGSLKLYFSIPVCCDCATQIQAPGMASKEKDVFYLKLQWISSKDEAEKKKLAEQIGKVLAEKSKG